MRLNCGEANVFGNESSGHLNVFYRNDSVLKGGGVRVTQTPFFLTNEDVTFPFDMCKTIHAFYSIYFIVTFLMVSQFEQVTPKYALIQNKPLKKTSTL